MTTYTNEAGNTVFVFPVKNNEVTAAYALAGHSFGIRYHGPDVEFKLRMKSGSKRSEKILKLATGHQRVIHFITRKGMLLIGGYTEQQSRLGQELIKSMGKS
jgi:hypothetical protein